MASSVDDVKNWMHMFRWIVKLIRDEYGVAEETLKRDASLEEDLGLTTEQIEQIMDVVAESFQISFPDGTLDEVLKLEELCMLAAWLKGLFKQPPFLSAGFAETCKSANALAA